ncbi:hypothetical protein LTR37_015417 [Vermiconidia calcicola]|uniref:Uncharacterized protein n=1 Tax=Vermiconidia calcicola TaxID=1690605 RepID=A0ACC3MQV5_9PEZI|nr:hypothetical protein LTR37_015417 [Vermiconidia calcicola]
MSPAVIDLTSSPEPDESPGKAAFSALQNFGPRKQRAMGNRQSKGFSESVAPNSLQEWTPPRQQEVAHMVHYLSHIESEDQHPPMPDDARTELQRVREQRRGLEVNGTQKRSTDANDGRLPTHKPSRPLAPGRQAPTLVEDGSLVALLKQGSVNGNGYGDNAARQPDRLRRRSADSQAKLNENQRVDRSNGKLQASDPDNQPNGKTTGMRPPASTSVRATNGAGDSGRSEAPTATATTGTGRVGHIHPKKDLHSSYLQPRTTFVGYAHDGIELRPFKRQRTDNLRKSQSYAPDIAVEEPTMTAANGFLETHQAPPSATALLGPSLDKIELRPFKRQRTDSLRKNQSYAPDTAVKEPTMTAANGFPETHQAPPSAAALLGSSLRKQSGGVPPKKRPQSVIEVDEYWEPPTPYIGLPVSHKRRSSTYSKTTGARQRIRTPDPLSSESSSENACLISDLTQRTPSEDAFASITGLPLEARISSNGTATKTKQPQRPSSSNTPRRGDNESLLRPPLSTPVRQAPATAATGNHGIPYTPEEDALLIKLKEVDGLTWQDIVPHFKGRTYGSIQVRYSTKLKHRSKIVQQSHGFADLTSSEPKLLLAEEKTRSATPEESGPARRPRRKRNNESSVMAGFISWTDVKKQRHLEDIDDDASEAHLAEQLCDSQFSGERAFPKSVSRILRQRELGCNAGRSWRHSTRSIPDELKEHVFDDVCPRRFFKGTSSDVTCLAWASDGERFAAGSIAITDERSMQYNKPCNLLLGDYSRSLLVELPEHHLPRPEVQTNTNVNSLNAMRETQDPRLFMTVASVQFAPNSQTLYSAGSDSEVRAYDVGRGVNQASCLYELEHPAPLDLLSVSNTGLLATACHQSADGSISVFDGQTQALSLSPSRINAETERAIYPSALRWGSAAQHQNLLLAGFSIDSIDEERDIAGETCLWDVRHEARISVAAVTRNVFDVAWNPSPTSSSIAFAVASTPGSEKKNRGTRSVVQCFAPGQGAAAARVLELQCPAFDVNDVVYCPYDDNLIATGATDGCVYVWDQRFVDKSHMPLHVLKHDDSLSVLDHYREREVADTGIRFLSWGATSSRLYSGSSDGVVKIWNPYRSTNDARLRDVATFTSAVMSGSFSPDYRELLIGEDQGRINLLSVGHGDKSICSMDRFKLQSAPAPQANTSGGRPEGHKAARELLKTGQIKLKPMGSLPVRQAVQASNYVGPCLRPTSRQMSDAEVALTEATTRQHEVHSRAAMSSSQSVEAGRTLQKVDKHVEDTQQAFLRLQTRWDDADILEPKASAMQLQFRRAEIDKRQPSGRCQLDCDYLPASMEDAEVPDSHRSEGRIPSALWHAPQIDLAMLTQDELVERGLTSKCISCVRPAPKPKKGKLPLCQGCTHVRDGLTALCEMCSARVRPCTDASPSSRNLCERCNFACFRCSRPASVKQFCITCNSCRLTWRAGVLGYELLTHPRPATALDGAVAKFVGSKQDEDDLEEHDLWGDHEREHYASLWQDK